MKAVTAVVPVTVVGVGESLPLRETWISCEVW